LKPRARPRFRPIRLSAAPCEEKPAPERRRARRIGLLGGSFNPAHAGHLHISLTALKVLELDEIWWLVTPQNPLKPVEGMAPFEERVAAAKRLVHDRRIRVSTVEARFGLRYTADTLRFLRRRFPRVRFVWLMGADNLGSFTRWRRWADIYAGQPVAIFARRPYAPRVLAAVPSLRFIRYRVPEDRARRLAEREPPAWAFFHIRLHAASATAIRAARGARRS
jgi:nicotinate-nucleotide adenylyltransferase